MAAQLLNLNLPDWQTLLSLAIVGVAFTAFVRRMYTGWFATNETGTCGSCAGCSQKQIPQGLKKIELFQLDSPAAKKSG